MDELDRCVKWMGPYADVCDEMLAKTERSNAPTADEDDENVHNIQAHYNYRLWLVSKLSLKYLTFFFELMKF